MRMRRIGSRSSGVLATLLLAIPVNGTAQQDLEAIEVILDYSLVDNVLEGQAAAFLVALEEVLGVDVDFESATVERVVREEFAPDRMRTYIVEELQATSLPAELTEISGLLQDGAIGQVSDLVADYEPSESFEAFMRSLQTSPPREDRVDLLAELADAQQLAGLYLLLDETIREGAHRVASIITDGESPPYVELERSIEEEQLQRGRQFAVASYLHRFRPVDDSLVASATADYLTGPGQSYVERYSLALAEAIQLAALRVSGRLSSGG